jgi:hypothetical protein
MCETRTAPGEGEAEKPGGPWFRAGDAGARDSGYDNLFLAILGSGPEDFGARGRLPPILSLFS